MPETKDKQLPDPQAGGRYVRNADGSTTRIHATKEQDPLERAAEKAERRAQLAAEGAERVDGSTDAANTDNDDQE
jgi:hypothetical protein